MTGSGNTPHLTATRTVFLDTDDYPLAYLDTVIWPHIGAVIEQAGPDQGNMVVKDVRLLAPFQEGPAAEVFVWLVPEDGGGLVSPRAINHVSFEDDNASWVEESGRSSRPLQENAI